MYQGSRADTFKIIDAAIAKIGTDKVVIIGHSMGATFGLQYVASRNNAKVVAVVPIALGHEVHLSGKMRRAFGEDAEKACALVEKGKGKKKYSFTEINKGSSYSIRATANFYCTHYNTGKLPSPGDYLPKVKVPVLWIAGKQDRLTGVYDTANLSQTVGAKNKTYKELDGNHHSVVYLHTKVIAKWLDSL